MKMQMIIQNTYKKASQTGAAPLGNTIMVYDNERLNPIDINKIIKIKGCRTRGGIQTIHSEKFSRR